jgi:hypothetical protein
LKVSSINIAPDRCAPAARKMPQKPSHGPHLDSGL